MGHIGRIAVDPAVMQGRPCIAGTRVTVGTVVGPYAEGIAHERILELYPYLTLDDLLAALAYAARASEERDLDLSGS